MVASLTTGQKAEFILDLSNGAALDENLIKNVFTSLLESDDESQLTGFFTSVNDIAVGVSCRAIIFVFVLKKFYVKKWML